jgi:hypothetical protein
MIPTSPSRQIAIARDLRAADIRAASSARRALETPASSTHIQRPPIHARSRGVLIVAWLSRHLRRPTTA